MSQELWTRVDEYFGAALHREDAGLEAALAACQAEGLPNISVSRAQARFLQVLVMATGARRILEIGTLGGYSAIAMARGLPEGGKVVTLEIEPRHAAIARRSMERAGVAGKIEIRVGRAVETLARMAGTEEAFDLAFIDADKPSNADYFAWAVKLSRPGTLIIVDNVVREGAVIEAGSRDENVQGVRRLVEAVAAEKRVRATVMQTVGEKKYDGFIVAVVESSG